MPLRLNLEYLRTFMAVVRCGGIGKAAIQLNLTQPAVTSRIRNLEESLSTSLFDRVNASLKLTKNGEMLIDYAEQFLHLAELVERDVIDQEGLQGRIKLGVSDTIAQSWLSEFIQSLNLEYPSLEVYVHTDNSVALRQLLLDCDIDLAILLGPISEPSVKNIDVPKVKLAWFTSSKHNIDEEKSLKRPITSYARGTKPYRELKKLLQENIGSDLSIFPSSSVSVCFKLIESGLCVGALPIDLAKEYLNKGTIKTFDPGWVPRPLQFTVSYVTEPESQLTEAAAKIALKVSKLYEAQ